MNKVILSGRLTTDPHITQTDDEKMTCVAHYILAVAKKVKRENNDSDFVRCVAFGKKAKFAQDYLKKGCRVNICGSIQTGNYTNQKGEKVYTTEIMIEDQEFAETKNQRAQREQSKEE